MLKLSNIYKTYFNKGNNCHALSGISIELPDNGMVFILGKSGSGKTTLLNLLGGLDSFDDGQYIFQEKNVSQYSEIEWDQFRNYKIGFVFQDYNLIESLTVKKNIELALDLQKRNENNEELVNEILDQVGLSELSNRRISELSGGQKQRIAIARALVKKPCMILADEPTGNLDETTGNEIYEILKGLSKKILVIVVTHDEKTSRTYGDRIITIKDGRISKDEINPQKNYSIEISNKKEKNIFKGTKNQILEQCLSFFDRLAFPVSYEVHINREENASNEKIERNKLKAFDNQERYFEKLNLNIKSTFSFAWASLSKRKVRCAFTILLFTLTALLCFFALNILRYKPSDVILSYYNEYPSEVYYLYENVSYTNDFFIEQQKKVNSGKIFYNKLASLDREGVVGVIENKGLQSFNYEYSTQVDIIIGDLSIDSSIIGLAPQTGEILLTDYLLSRMGLSSENAIGAKIWLNSELFTVSGYYLTDYIEYDVDSKLFANPFNQYAQWRRDKEYAIVFLSDIYDLDNGKRRLDINGNNLVFANSLTSYVNSESSFASISWEDNINLIIGRKPETNNEIIISSSYLNVFESLGYSQDYLLNHKLYYPDIYDTKYNDFYQDLINLHDYFIDGVKIVGIYNPYEFLNLSNANIVVTEEVFQKLSDEFYSYYSYDSFFLKSQVSGREIVGFADKNCLEIDNISFNLIYSLSDLFEDLLPYAIIVLIILFIITLILNITHIGYSIKDGAKSIGILRALGVTRKDTLKIFIIEACLIGLMTIVLLGILSMSCTTFINLAFRATLSEFPFNILSFDFFSFFIVAILVLFLSLLSAYLPIVQLAKKNPIEIIKGS